MLNYKTSNVFERIEQKYQWCEQYKRLKNYYGHKIMVYKYIHKPFKLFKLIPSKLCVPRCWSFTALFTSGEKGSLKFFF